VGLFYFIEENMNPQNSADALGQLQTAQKTAQNPQSFLAAQQQALGVPSQQEAVQGLRGAIAGTTKLLNNVAPSVAGRAANSLVTAAGAQRQIANEQAPVAANLQSQGNQYSQASQDLADIQNKALQQAQLQYQGQQDQVSYLQNLYNTLYSREQAAAQAAEQKRQFDAQLAESRRASSASSGGGYDLSGIASILGGDSKTGSTAKNYIGNDDFRGALAFAASKGNNDAKLALNKVGNDRKAAGPVTQAEYDALKRLGITGSYYVSKPAAKTNYTPNAGISNGYYGGSLGLGR